MESGRPDFLTSSGYGCRLPLPISGLFTPPPPILYKIITQIPSIALGVHFLGKGKKKVFRTNSYRRSHFFRIKFTCCMYGGEFRCTRGVCIIALFIATRTGLLSIIRLTAKAEIVEFQLHYSYFTILYDYIEDIKRRSLTQRAE